ncbi:hypothetical protein DFS34DRAFT_95550 [Phlyctochytrium arcticum]|nr:hypothetical protein DFS34DRAFT_95550 [Phlyctochytrium arcticum]
MSLLVSFAKAPRLGSHCFPLGSAVQDPSPLNSQNSRDWCGRSKMTRPVKRIQAGSEIKDGKTKRAACRLMSSFVCLVSFGVCDDKQKCHRLRAVTMTTTQILTILPSTSRSDTSQLQQQLRQHTADTAPTLPQRFQDLPSFAVRSSVRSFSVDL